MSRTPSASSPPAFNPGQSPNLVFSRPRAPSPYMKSLLTYIDAVNNRDFEAMDSVFDESLEHRILPKSLERPVLTKKQYGDYWRSISGLFEQFEVSSCWLFYRCVRWLTGPFGFLFRYHCYCYGPTCFPSHSPATPPSLNCERYHMLSLQLHIKSNIIAPSRFRTNILCLPPMSPLPIPLFPRPLRVDVSMSGLSLRSLPDGKLRPP